MTAVAPIGDEIADRAVFVSGFGCCTQIGERVVMFANERLPRRSAGTDVEWNLCLRELRGFQRKRMICFVTPVQGNYVCSSGRESALIRLSRLTSAATRKFCQLWD